MLMLLVPLSLILLGYTAVKARKAGMSGWEVALIVVVGSICIVIVMFGILFWGFRNFG